MPAPTIVHGVRHRCLSCLVRAAPSCGPWPRDDDREQRRMQTPVYSRGSQYMRSLSVCSVVRRVLASVGGDSDVRLVFESRQPGSHHACRPALARPARCSSHLFGLVGVRSQPGQRKNLFGCPSYKPFHVVRSFLHRPSLAGWRRRIFLHPASLARRHLLHRAGLAQTLLQATNQDHGASSEPGWLICRQPNTPVSLGPALHCTWACNCAQQDMSLQLNHGSSSTTHGR